MQADIRQSRIEQFLQQSEFASLEELANQVGASLSTVRRDLTILEAGGFVKRTHGGARIIPRTGEFSFSARDTHQLAEKEAIGRCCAELIKPNQSVILDAGTTVYHVARHLENKAPQIITNSLPIANLFAAANKLEVVVSGGVIYPRLGVLVGPLAVESFANIHADVAIMGAGGLTLQGITNSHGLLIDIQRIMINAVRKVLFCIDSTKFGRQSVLPLCNLSRVSAIVTDAGAPEEMVTNLRRDGVEVIVAPADL
jgi:DeoR family transcriptional regulator, fructose operon transcriptional repressor